MDTQRRPLRPTVLLLAILLVLISAGAGALRMPFAAQGQATPSPDARDNFLLGVNYPWLRYGGDFGTNQWANGSISTDTAAYAAEVADMTEKGVNVVRWFVFADGRSILSDANGVPTGIAGNVTADLDAALAIAANHGITLDLVLFDYLLLKKASLDGAGHADWINEEAKRTALIENVVRPTLAHVGSHPSVRMWEVMNEPEWAIADLPNPALSGEVDPTTQASFWDFASRVTAAVHALTNAQATIGSASLFWAQVWTNAYARDNGLPALNLDVYQTHYYPSPNDDRYNPFLKTYDEVAADFGLDKPLIVGEFTLTEASQLDALLANGYAGGWPWSYRGGDPRAMVNWDAFTTWAQGGGPSPTPTGEPTATSLPACDSGPIVVDGTSLTLVSTPGICWGDVTSGGAAVLTYGHVGCSGVDGSGTCTGGAWPGAGVSIDGAQWIWKSQQADQGEIGRPVQFYVPSFVLPDDATAITGTVRITADNSYRLIVNDDEIGANTDLESWREIETYSVPLIPGYNAVMIEAANLGSAASSPSDNPAGLLFRLDVSFTRAPTATVTPLPTDTPSPTDTVTSSPTSTPRPTQTPTATATNSATPTSTPARRPTRTPAPTNTPKPTRTPVPTKTPLPQPPAAPTNLTASQSRSDITLTWRDNATNETGYRVYRSADNGRTWTLIADGLPVDTSSFTDPGVPRGTPLRYAVAAFNPVGESKRSNTVRVTVP